MVKQWPPSPHQKFQKVELSSGMKNHQVRCSETLTGSDPSMGRRTWGGEYNWNSKVALLHGLKNDSGKFNSCKGAHLGKRHLWFRRHVRSIAFQPRQIQEGLEENTVAYVNREKPPNKHAWPASEFGFQCSRREIKQEKANFWKEPYRQAALWKPCADRRTPNIGKPDKSNGHIMVSANGGLNQQRVAVIICLQICNAVAVASLLNATLVLPRFLYSNVWKDPRLLIADIVKEAKPIDYVRKVLPLLAQNGIVHFLGFGNRLGFDPLPSNLQRLRCKLFLDKQLLGNFMPNTPSKHHGSERDPSKYLALHLRFEEDMVAYSQCDFGGGENEKKELQSYREIHFPLLIERLKNSKPISQAELRKLGRCPLTPEEAALILSALGFKRGTYIYLAGSQIYGGKSRMDPFTSLYPNLVTKETLLTKSELEPFTNFSSQLAALDFIACATADVFAMTDSGSQLSSLVSGFRTYYGGGHAPNLRPNKKRLAAILSENSTIGWNEFEDRVRKMIEEGQRVRVRGYGRSIYRQPRCPECMCRSY
ncbi:hypothetical protein Patl1_10490 [Pistacia atlantica]|uniref:Uncharacterized protein n=1 Tax=Pistacia atlantica TaxID=434234 RepID=A0ACC1A5J9_9ROSI|nr:hypothetical protein Patl1_10490 [Pistacia atlantica]